MVGARDSPGSIGLSVGLSEGLLLGLIEGLIEGLAVGSSVGLRVGLLVGRRVGSGVEKVEVVISTSIAWFVSNSMSGFASIAASRTSMKADAAVTFDFTSSTSCRIFSTSSTGPKNVQAHVYFPVTPPTLGMQAHTA